MGSDLPSGVVTFLFTDVEGSTRLFQAFPDSYADLLSRHRELIRTASQTHGGVEVETAGDAFFLAFSSPDAALRAAIDAQLALRDCEWPLGASIRVRMGLHSGEATPTADGYIALPVHLAARVQAAAHGQQILVSESTRDLVGSAEEVTFNDLGEHTLKDIETPVRLFQVRHPDLRSEFPPVRTRTAATGSLPPRFTSFVGRDQEMREVRKLLEGSRLVTLVGPGGGGKTRLGIEAAADLVGDYEGGVWFVDLLSAATEDDVLGAIAEGLGLRPERDVLESINAHLAIRPAVLVLDNCEHVVDACRTVVTDLLSATVGTDVLATSREPLSVSGEITYAVPPLALPSPRAPADEIATTDAVVLFLDRARFAKPDFAPDQDALRDIAETCRLLDGIPLAIELAAARIRALGPSEIAKQLDRRLEPGRPGVPTDRHTTLRDTFIWSYELLTDAEQATLRRLSVFVGGFTLEAAESACVGIEGPTGADVVDVVTRLVDRSLVQVEGERFRMIEAVRRLGAELAEGAGEEAEVTEWFLRWIETLAEREGSRLKTEQEQQACEALEAEVDNLLAGLERMTAEPARAATVVVRTATFWSLSGRSWIALPYLEAALVDEHAPADLRWRTPEFALSVRRFDDSKRWAAEALDEAERTGDHRQAGYAAWVLARARRATGDASGTMLEAGLVHAHAAGDERLVTGLHSELVWVKEMQGNYPEALTLARDVLDRCDTPSQKANALASLARVELNRGELERAVESQLRAVEHQRAVGDPRWIAIELLHAVMYLRAVEDPRAERYEGEARGLLQTIDPGRMGLAVQEGLMMAMRFAPYDVAQRWCEDAIAWGVDGQNIWVGLMVAAWGEADADAVGAALERIEAGRSEPDWACRAGLARLRGDHEGTLEALIPALDAAGDNELVVRSLFYEGAWVAGALGRPDVAATLVGAAQNHMSATPISRAGLREELREKLGARFDELVEQGANMPIEDSITLVCSLARPET